MTKIKTLAMAAVMAAASLGAVTVPASADTMMMHRRPMMHHKSSMMHRKMMMHHSMRTMRHHRMMHRM